MKKHVTVAFLTILFAIFLAACTNGSDDVASENAEAMPSSTVPNTSTAIPVAQPLDDAGREDFIGNWELTHDRGFTIETNVYLILKEDGTYLKYLFTPKSWQRSRYLGNWQVDGMDLILHTTSESQYNANTKAWSEEPCEDKEIWKDCMVTDNQIIRGAADDYSKQIRYSKFEDERLDADVFQGFD